MSKMPLRPEDLSTMNVTTRSTQHTGSPLSIMSGRERERERERGEPSSEEFLTG